MKAQQREYRKTKARAAERLRSLHQLSLEESRLWAHILMDDDTRCDICGIPKHKLVRLFSWKCGGERKNRRMSFDHITPGVNDGNYRPLCFSCNTIRGANRFTDEEVLNEMRGWYRFIYALRKLYWLNTHVDPVSGMCVGGRKERSPRQQAKIDDLRAGGDE